MTKTRIAPALPVVGLAMLLNVAGASAQAELEPVGYSYLNAPWAYWDSGSELTDDVVSSTWIADHN